MTRSPIGSQKPKRPKEKGGRITSKAERKDNPIYATESTDKKPVKVAELDPANEETTLRRSPSAGYLKSAWGERKGRASNPNTKKKKESRPQMALTLSRRTAWSARR